MFHSSREIQRQLDTTSNDINFFKDEVQENHSYEEFLEPLVLSIHHAEDALDSIVELHAESEVMVQDIKSAAEHAISFLMKRENQVKAGSLAVALNALLELRSHLSNVDQAEEKWRKRRVEKTDTDSNLGERE